MSTTDKVTQTVKDSIKSTEEFIESAKRSLQAELSKTTPKIQHTLDQSMDDAGRGLTNTFASIDKKTAREQLELLNGYRRFLQGQIVFVEERIRAVKKD